MHTQTRGVVYSARESHNLTGRAQLPTPQHTIVYEYQLATDAA